MRNPTVISLTLLLMTGALWTSASELTAPSGKERRLVTSAMSIRRSEPLLTGSSCTVTECNRNAQCETELGPSACLQLTCSEVAWRACIQDRGLTGLWLGRVDLKRAPAEPWINVLWEAGLADLLTIYHQGDRIDDMQFCPSASAPGRCLRALEQSAVGSSGTLVRLAGEVEPRIAVELRDRGIAWLCTWQDGPERIERSRPRRGEEMALWGVYDTGNYDFIIEYGFRDDGTIRFRLGATGYNNPAPEIPTTEAHMHTALWRLDVDLNGYADDTARLLIHREGDPTPAEATDLEQEFNDGKEGGQPWIPELFTTLLVEDRAVNAQGKNLGYELAPSRRGSARHFGPTEEYTQSDYWVTRWHPHETGYTWPNDWHRDGAITPDTFLVEAAGSGGGSSVPESVVDEDIVIWYVGSAHHKPHDEDKSAVDPGPDPEGVTLVHWLGFDLVPHNLFDHNPLSGPHRTECGQAP